MSDDLDKILAAICKQYAPNYSFLMAGRDLRPGKYNAFAIYTLSDWQHGTHLIGTAAHSLASILDNGDPNAPKDIIRRLMQDGEEYKNMAGVKRSPILRQ